MSTMPQQPQTTPEAFGQERHHEHRFRLMITLAAHNQLSALRRLCAIGSQDGGFEDDRRLGEARHFSQLGVSLIEKAQCDLVFWRLRRRLLGGKE